MRDALRIAQIGRRVVDDQVFCINAFAHWAIADRAEVNLLECSAAEAEHQQHAVGVGIILARDSRQIMVEIFLKRGGKLVLLIR